MYRDTEFSELSSHAEASITDSQAGSRSISVSVSQNPLRIRYGDHDHDTGGDGTDSPTSSSTNAYNISSSAVASVAILSEFVERRPAFVSADQCASLMMSAERTARLAMILRSTTGAKNRQHLFAVAFSLLKQFCDVAKTSVELCGSSSLFDEACTALRNRDAEGGSPSETMQILHRFATAVVGVSASRAAGPITFSLPISRGRLCDGCMLFGVSGAVVTVSALAIANGVYWALIPLGLQALGLIPAAATFVTHSSGSARAVFHIILGTCVSFFAVAQCVAATVHDSMLQSPLHVAALPLLGYMAHRIQNLTAGVDTRGHGGNRRDDRMHKINSAAGSTSGPASGGGGGQLASGGSLRSPQSPALSLSMGPVPQPTTLQIRPRTGEVLGALWLIIFALCLLIRGGISAVPTDGNSVALEVCAIIAALCAHYALVVASQGQAEAAHNTRIMKEAVLEEIENADVGSTGVASISGPRSPAPAGFATDLVSLPPQLAIGVVPVGTITLAGGNLCLGGELLFEPHGVRGILRTPAQALHDHVAVIVADLSGKVFLWNAYLESLTNLGSHNVEGRSLISLIAPPSTPAQLTSVLSSLSLDHRVQPFCLSLVRNHISSPSVELSWTPTPAKTASGETVGIVLIGMPSSGARDVARAVTSLTTLLDDLQHNSVTTRDCLVQLNEVATALRETLPLTSAVAISQIVGRLMTVHFAGSAVQFDVRPDAPDNVEVSEGKLQAVLIEALSHYVAGGPVTLAIGPGGMGGGGRIEDRASTPGAVGHSDVSFLIVPSYDAAEAWRPTPAAAEALKEIRGRVSSSKVPRRGVLIRLIGVAVSQVIASRRESIVLSAIAGSSHTLGSSSASSNGAPPPPTDEVRCSVAVHCPDTVTSTVIRNVVWGRSHLLYFVDDARTLSMSLDGIDVFFVLVPEDDPSQETFRSVVADAIESRTSLITIALLTQGSQPGPMWRAVGFDFVISAPIRVQDVHHVLTQAARRVAEIRGKEQKFKEVKKLLSATKTCPWVRGRLLGRGTSATVYEATNTITEGKMAVRMVTIPQSNPAEMQETMEGLISEITLMAQLDHKNIINYLYCERGETTLNIFMEYAAGGSLRSVIDKRGPCSIAQLGIWLQDILEGLEYLHNEGVAHLDIKAANVLLTNQGVCKLSDFGTAKRLTQTRALVTSATMPANGEAPQSTATGTMHFMAPEVITHQQYDTRCDVWSVGCMCVELLTGKLPFSHLNAGPLGVVGYVGSLRPNDVVELPPKITDPEVISFLRLCLCPDPARRATCRTLLQHPLVSDAPRQRTSIYTANPRLGVGGSGVGGSKPSSQAGFASPVAYSSDEENERRDSCFSNWSSASSQVRRPSMQPKRSQGDVTTPKARRTTATDEEGSAFYM